MCHVTQSAYARDHTRDYTSPGVGAVTEVQLIEHNESERQRAAKEKAKLKAKGSRYVQKSGVIRVGDARAQIAQRETEEWLREENRHVINMAEQRAQRAVVLDEERQARLAATVTPLPSWKGSRKP